MSVTVITAVPYAMANGKPLLLGIAHPDPLPAEPMPAVIEIHGGGWAEGERGVDTESILPNNGFFYASIDYRLSGDASFPAQIHDAKAAVRWLRAHANAYHVDPTRIGLWGGSAGAHLAALLGVSGNR